ncbi:unnamed protein product [Amoebophrya sp. A25]|nr:unnamed protein product [Amoebophrya sp. A25]|eukprot:GSA25T00026899001.1
MSRIISQEQLTSSRNSSAHDNSDSCLSNSRGNSVSDTTTPKETFRGEKDERKGKTDTRSATSRANESKSSPKLQKSAKGPRDDAKPQKTVSRGSGSPSQEALRSNKELSENMNSLPPSNRKARRRLAKSRKETPSSATRMRQPGQGDSSISTTGNPPATLCDTSAT